MSVYTNKEATGDLRARPTDHRTTRVSGVGKASISMRYKGTGRAPKPKKVTGNEPKGRPERGRPCSGPRPLKVSNYRLTDCYADVETPLLLT